MNNGYNNGQPGGYRAPNQYNGYPRPGMPNPNMMPYMAPRPSGKISGAAIASMILAVLMFGTTFLPLVHVKVSAFYSTYSASASLMQLAVYYDRVNSTFGSSTASDIAGLFVFILGTVILEVILVILLCLLGKNSKGARIGALIATIPAHLVIGFFSLALFAAAGQTNGASVGIGCWLLWLLSVAVIVTTAINIPNRNKVYVQPGMYGNPNMPGPNMPNPNMPNPNVYPYGQGPQQYNDNGYNNNGYNGPGRGY